MFVATGEVVSGVKKSDLKKISTKLKRQGIESAAVRFLFSYKTLQMKRQ